MSNKKIIVIGAGMAGLSTGCYLQMNGYDTEIFELHTLPGGLCTSWEREGYTFDEISFLVGINPNLPGYDQWNELVDMSQIEFTQHSEYIRVEDQQGQSITISADIDETERNMLEKAPEDKDIISDFIKAARAFISRENYEDFAKWGKVSSREFSQRVRNPLLKKTFESITLGEQSIAFTIMVLALFHLKMAGMPIGGSLKFIRRFEKKYLDLGGKIHYKSRVKKILTKDDAAAGVLLDNGQTHYGDIVVSTADGHATIFDMLEGLYTDKKVLDIYENFKVFPSYLLVGLGIAHHYPELASGYVLPLEQPLRIDRETTLEDIGVSISNFDPTLAPQGKTTMTILISTPDYSYWVDLRETDREKYKLEKKRIANAIIETLDKRFGNVKANLEVWDIATPATVVRYTNNWKGSMLGWMLTPKDDPSPLDKQLPGLRNFYMAGQWVQPGGGVSEALASGRSVAEMICQKDRKPFSSSQS